MVYYPRSAWTSAPKTGSRLKRDQTEIYVHWPATAGTIGTSTERIKDYLRAWLRLHTKDRGWSDIAYNIGVDQNGDEWELRGIDRQCGGNGGTTTNRRGQAILAIMGMDETPSPAMIRGIQRAVARIRRKHPTATKILGHRDSFEASTSCPGTKLYALVKSGAFEPAGGAPLPSEPGNSGLADVDKSQAWLAELGYDPGPQDGTFGTRTATATRAFQQEHGITPADGRPGPVTRQALEAEVSKLEQKIDRAIALIGRVPTEVWDHPVTLHGSEFEGKKSTPARKVEWKDHEHERVRRLAEQAAKNSAEALERSERIEAKLDRLLQAPAEQPAEG